VTRPATGSAGGRTVRFGTFDAERWWRPEHLATLPSAPGGRPAATDELLAGLCDPGDLLITRRPLPDDLRAGLHAAGIEFDHRSVATGDETVEAALRRQPELLAGDVRIEPWAVLPGTPEFPGRPPVGVVATVNGKAWSHRLVEKLGLPGAGRLVRSIGELERAVEQTGYDAVVKDTYGVSGRATLAVRTPGVLRAITRTLAKQTGREIELLVQPHYQVQDDFSGQLYVDPDGRVRTLGVTLLHNDGFRYAGSEPAPAALTEKLTGLGYPDVLRTVGEQLAAAGYHGPAGVDSMLLTDGTLIPILEVNARCTLGLLTLKLAERWRDRGTTRLRQAARAPEPGPGIVLLSTAGARVHYAEVTRA
jgi:hypothetical protein